jgi:sigma-B regulation protein RsbU (phosphoserine phosphatase)
VNLSIQSVWKRAGKVEKTFAAALILYLILLAAWPDSAFEAFVAFVTFVLGAWIAFRLLRIGLRKLTWSLRNRLMVAYLFIAVLPILLVLTLVGLGAYILAGQVAVYLVRSELDRRLVSLRSVAQDLSASPANIQRIGETEKQRFPGLTVWTAQNGANQKWPPDANLTWPAKLPVNSVGIAVREGRYYAWTAIVDGNRQVLVLTPLTRRFLSLLRQGLGDVYFVQRDFVGTSDASAALPAASKSKDAGSSAGSTKIGAGDQGEFRLAPSGGDAPQAAVPPPVNRFDVGVRWGSVMRAVDWEHPESNESALLVGYTRLSSILSTVLSQSSDELGGVVLTAFYVVAVAFLLVAITGLAIGIFMSRSITGAVHSLYEGTERVMRGDFSHLIRVSGRDQLADLSGSFNTMTQNLERLLAVAKEKERMQAEIEIARGVQDQLYPKAPPVFESLQVLGMCHPARMVSGDYYDYQLVDGKLAIAIGDVAGKGISAALLMATIQAAMRMELRASADVAATMNGLRFSTARMVSELNQQLHATTSPEKYATFFFAIFDQATGLLTYTNAGHLQPVLFREGVATPLDVNGTVVGAFPFSTYEESKLELRSGDLLVCYTDGITEPENEYGEMFGEERLIELVAKNSDRDEAQIIECVMERVREWTGVPELSDDMTVLLARKR